MISYLPEPQIKGVMSSLQRFMLRLNAILFSLLCCTALLHAQEEHAKSVIHLRVDSALSISSDQHELLRYEFRTVYPPAGVDSSYRRSGFIHPIYTLGGHRLTRIQPADHYHHYGIWNPWTHTLFEKDTVDFWNLHKKTGTVRFVKLLDHQKTDRSATYTALHHHIALKDNGEEKIALEEWQSVHVQLPHEEQDHYWVDITIRLRCGTNSPVKLLAYRYGGLTWRATEFWNGKNSMVLTSTGTHQDNTDGTHARWCLVQGNLPANAYGGMAILSHPDNYNHPEPLRIWDSKANKGKENIFINFSPTKDRDWLLEAGNTYVLRYRLVVFDGEYNAENMNKQWEHYASSDFDEQR